MLTYLKQLKSERETERERRESQRDRGERGRVRVKGEE